MKYKLIYVIILVLIVTLFPLQQQGDSHVLANQDEGHPFKAITYNIHSGKKRSGEPSIDQITQLLASENADFIALQEVDRRLISSGMQDQISILADRLHMEYVYIPSLQIGPAQYGNAILSRYPILATGQLELAGGKERRMLIWAQVFTEKGSLYLTSVHLDTDRASRPAHFKKIKEFLGTHLTDAPVLLMGDLNTLHDQPDLIQLEKDLTGKYRDYEFPTFYHQKAKRSIQIDYILGRGIIEDHYYTIDSDASDHIPLVLIFDIGKLPHMDTYPDQLQSPA